jgi:hypothetical protein
MESILEEKGTNMNELTSCFEQAEILINAKENAVVVAAVKLTDRQCGGAPKLLRLYDENGRVDARDVTSENLREFLVYSNRLVDNIEFYKGVNTAQHVIEAFSIGTAVGTIVNIVLKIGKRFKK